MNKPIRLLISAGIFILFLAVARPSNAAILSLDPASTSQPSGQTFTVKLAIDTEGDSVTSADAVLSYNSSIVQVVSVATGDNGQSPFFPDFYHNITPNQLYIGANVIDPIDTRTGQGVVATITFQGVNQGTMELKFDCTAGKSSDTNINKSDKNATDIVDCTRLVIGRYTIGSGIVPTQPIGQPVVEYATPTPAPTLVVTGSVNSTATIAFVGLLFLGIAGGSLYFIKA